MLYARYGLRQAPLFRASRYGIWLRRRQTALACRRTDAVPTLHLAQMRVGARTVLTGLLADICAIRASIFLCQYIVIDLSIAAWHLPVRYANHRR